MSLWKIGVKKCYRCGGIFDKNYMKIVKDTYISCGIEGEEVTKCNDRYYCDTCKPAYDFIDRTENEDVYTKIVKVDEKGNIL